LAELAEDHGLRPDLLVVTGDLAERGLPSEFRQATEFLAALAQAAGVLRLHVAIVPGNHDVNRRACRAYFTDCQSREEEPLRPYFPKWRDYAGALRGFYSGVPGVTFSPDEPWVLVVVRGGQHGPCRSPDAVCRAHGGRLPGVQALGRPNADRARLVMKIR